MWVGGAGILILVGLAIFDLYVTSMGVIALISSTATAFLLGVDIGAVENGLYGIPFFISFGLSTYTCSHTHTIGFSGILVGLGLATFFEGGWGQAISMILLCTVMVMAHLVGHTSHKYLSLFYFI